MHLFTGGQAHLLAFAVSFLLLVPCQQGMILTRTLAAPCSLRSPWRALFSRISPTRMPLRGKEVVGLWTSFEIS
jgi:hypothetical protein